MNELKFSILIPTYNGASFLGVTLRSILSQSFTNYEIIISDDASTDETEKVVKTFPDFRIKFFKNKKNLGYPGNLEEARKKAEGDIIFLMGQDDVLGADALLDTYNAFRLSEDIGAVTRPYYWFDRDIARPVRAKDQLNPRQDEIITITDNPDKIVSVFNTLDQLSGLAIRKKFMDRSFHPDIFPCHVYPIASVFRRHPVVFLKNYNVAVRISSSQTRHLSSIYEKSPLESWVEMFEAVFSEKELGSVKKYCIENFVARNYVGLVQLRNYARYQYFLREVKNLIKYRKKNILSPSFWFFSLGCVVTPPFILIPLVDWYKNKIYSLSLGKVKMKYYL